MQWLLILFGVCGNATASVLVKAAARRGGADHVLGLINPLMILAVGIYGLAFLSYSLALTRLPLNIANPVMVAGAIILVGLSSVLLFRERVTLAVALGYGMLLAGIILLSSGAWLKI